MNDESYVRVNIDLEGSEMGREEMWPDDDCPEDPTADDVVDLINGVGGLHVAIDDWCLVTGATVTVIVNKGDGSGPRLTRARIR